MLGLVRFAVGPDNMLCAEIEPKYDILTLMENHFSKRFANEKWLIYDSKRDYGLFHDRTGCQVVTLPGYKSGAMDLKDSFTDLWREFYKSIAIKERENPKLLRRCLPVRYWNHLPERSMATAVT
jgi:probable DNA metabolism protein